MSLDIADAPVVDADKLSPQACAASPIPAAREPRATEAAETSLDAAPSWMLRTASGLNVHVPARLASITTYVLLEQERWFETEFEFVEKLLDADSWALDIGANHGIYSLAMARCLPQGRVIAFEPTQEPRSRLLRSILDNGFADRIAVAPIGLSDSAREVTFNLSSDSELNSMHGAGGTSETVRLDRLDDFLLRHAPSQSFDFVKLDAEGEEPAVLRGGDHFFRSQSPIVMFELMHGSTINRALPTQFEAFGYGIYRHLPGLDVLAPWSVDSTGPDVPLNLFAIKPDRVRALEARGLVAEASGDASQSSPPAGAASANTTTGRAWLGAQSCFARADTKPHGWPTDPTVSKALDLLIAVHTDTGLTATERLQAAESVVEMLSAGWPTTAAASEPDLPPLHALITLVHALRLTGRHNAAIRLAQHALWAWPRNASVDSLYLPPDLADLERECTSTAAEWLRLVLAEYVERQRAFSSYFARIDPLQLRRLLRHPDHSAEMERRYALSEFRHNRVPDLGLLPKLAAGTGSVNPGLWNAVLNEPA